MCMIQTRQLRLALPGVVVVVALLFGAGTAPAGTQDDAVVALHAQTWFKQSCTLSAPTIPCSDYTTEWPTNTPAAVYMVVAEADPGVGIGGVSLGVSYPMTDMFLTYFNCGGLEATGGGWPNDGGGMRMAWDTGANCQTNVIPPDGVHATVGYFYMYAYTDAQFAITPNLNLFGGPEFQVADCSASESDLDPTSGAAILGFGAASGYNPCCGACVEISAQDAAACVGDTASVLVTMVNCSADTADLVLDCDVDGVPQTPQSFPGMAGGDTAFASVQVICSSPGSVPVDCIVTATDSSDPTCSAADTAAAGVTCGEACADLVLSSDATQKCVGDTSTVTATATNCAAEAADLVVTCEINGVPLAPTQFMNVPASESRQVNIPIACTIPGQAAVVCSLQATSTSNPSCIDIATDSIAIDCLDIYPLITSIVDIPIDQGRRVRVSWNASCYDHLGDATVDALDYAVWRRIDSLPALEAPGGYRTMAYPPGDWDFVTTVPARGESEYNVVVETLCDSTLTAGQCYSVFFVSAQTSDPHVYFDSPPDSGYSVDNLAPSVPGSFSFSFPATLSWDEVPEEDFDYFSVYGSTSDVLDGNAVLIDHTTGTSISVSKHPYQYYHVTATDFSGNEGKPATLLTPVGVPEPGFTPVTYALGQNRPNPYRSSTLISFDLPEEGPVQMRVFDVSGKLIKTLVNQPMAPGRYAIPWAGDDDGGRQVPPGIYLYRIEVNGFSETRKAILVR